VRDKAWVVDLSLPWDGPFEVRGRLVYIASHSVSVDSTEARIDGVCLESLTASLMSMAGDARAALLDFIGKDACKEHFGLVELAEPSAGEKDEAPGWALSQSEREKLEQEREDALREEDDALMPGGFQ
jgi:hypothetical protein